MVTLARRQDSFLLQKLGSGHPERNEEVEAADLFAWLGTTGRGPFSHCSNTRVLCRSQERRLKIAVQPAIAALPQARQPQNLALTKH